MKIIQLEVEGFLSLKLQTSGRRRVLHGDADAVASSQQAGDGSTAPMAA